MIRVQNRLDKLENTAITFFYFILRVLLSAGIGFITAKCTILDDFSPFSIILLTVSSKIGLIPTACFLSSALAHLSAPLDLTVFKYITALTMIYVVYMVFQKSMHIIKNDSAILSALCCFASGFLFLLPGQLTLFSVLLLLCESVLICCCVYFINYAVKAFQKNCALSPREMIAIAVTFTLILVALQNITFFSMNTTRVLSFIILFLALSLLKTSHVAVLGCSLAILLASVENGGGEIFTAIIVGTLAGCVFSNFSERFAVSAFVVAYFSTLFFFGNFLWNYQLFCEPIVSMTISFFIPKKPLKTVLSSYIAVKNDPKGSRINDKAVLNGCRRHCKAVCPKADICYEKNFDKICSAIETISTRAIEVQSIEELLPFCIKPNAMMLSIKKQCLVYDGEQIETLVDQLNRITQKIEIKLSTTHCPIVFFKNEEDAIVKELEKRNLQVRDINFIADENQEKKCDISFSCSDNLIYEKVLHETITPYFDHPISIKITENNENYWAHIKEKCNYSITCAALCKNKNGESLCGDNAMGFSINKSTYCILLADGMGSGKEAGFKSKSALNTLHKLMIGGVDVSNALNIFRASERLQDSQYFTTIDICIIDLEHGSADLYKAGAFDSYLLHKDKLSKFRGGGLPLGIGDQDRVQHHSIRIADGDYLIMGSDGLAASSFQVENAIMLSKDENVKDYALKILKYLSEHNDGNNRDDITVIAAKIQKNAEY